MQIILELDDFPTEWDLRLCGVMSHWDGSFVVNGGPQLLRTDAAGEWTVIGTIPNIEDFEDQDGGSLETKPMAVSPSGRIYIGGDNRIYVLEP